MVVLGALRSRGRIGAEGDGVGLAWTKFLAAKRQFTTRVLNPKACLQRLRAEVLSVMTWGSAVWHLRTYVAGLPITTLARMTHLALHLFPPTTRCGSTGISTPAGMLGSNWQSFGAAIPLRLSQRERCLASRRWPPDPTAPSSGVVGGFPPVGISVFGSPSSGCEGATAYWGWNPPEPAARSAPGSPFRSTVVARFPSFRRRLGRLQFNRHGFCWGRRFSFSCRRPRDPGQCL